MRSKKHAILAALFSIPIFIEKEFLLGLIILSFAIWSFYKYINHPQRLLLLEIDQDKKKFNITIPRSYPLHLDFLKIYSKYLRLSTQYPTLKNTYKELIESMWLKLSEHNSVKSWREIIQKTDQAWPSPIDVKSLLNKNLNKVSAETQMLNRAMVKAK